MGWFTLSERHGPQRTVEYSVVQFKVAVHELVDASPSWREEQENKSTHESKREN
jgi:hypothetical protein